MGGGLWREDCLGDVVPASPWQPRTRRQQGRQIPRAGLATRVLLHGDLQIEASVLCTHGVSLVALPVPCLPLLLYLHVPVCAGASAVVRVGAWNCQVFGQSKYEEVGMVPVLVDILQAFDLLLFQEIRDVSESYFPRLMADLNNATSPGKQ